MYIRILRISSNRPLARCRRWSCPLRIMRKLELRQIGAAERGLNRRRGALRGQLFEDLNSAVDGGFLIVAAEVAKGFEIAGLGDAAVGRRTEDGGAELQRRGDAVGELVLDGEEVGGGAFDQV